MNPKFYEAIRDTLFALLTDKSKERAFIRQAVTEAPDRGSAAQAAIIRYLSSDYKCYPFYVVGDRLTSLSRGIAPPHLVAAACEDAWQELSWDAVSKDPLVSSLIDELRGIK